jgi:hypothetical protein
MKTSDLLLGMGFALMILVYIIQMYLTKRLLDELKARFTDQWAQLGKPSLILNNSLSNNAALISFLWYKKYLALDDADFSKRCLTARVFSLFALIFGIAWIAAVLTVILLTKK